MWDERYDTDTFIFGTEPSQFLTRNSKYLKPGERALAIADGEGRNSVFLAKHKLNITAMDGSKTGIAKAKKLATDAGVQIDFQLADLRDWEWTPETYDVVVAIFFQFAEPEFRDEIFKGIEQTLKPGGVLLLHGYTEKQLEYRTGGPPDIEKLYTKAMLQDRFSHWDILELNAYETVLDEGPGHSGMSALIDLVARKPG